MIYTELSNLAAYQGLSKNLDGMIDYLKRHPLEELALGKNVVDGDAAFINRFDYHTVPEDKIFYEAHLEYADVHLVLSGEEYIRVSDTETMTEFERDEATDFVGYRGDAQAVCAMKPGKVLIVFPGEAHAVKVQYKGECLVCKAVGKVRLPLQE